MFKEDTIVANATPLVPSGVAIVRLSGKKALEIGKKIFKTNKEIKARVAYFGKFYDTENNLIDEGLFLYFKAPHSFTGEDVVEFHTHGSIPVVKKLLNEAIKLGARLAQPGEFTKRAFLNGKIDLTQAEAIAQLIEAKTEKASKVALNILEGKLSKQIKQLRDKLLHIESLIEAELNFPEDVDEIPLETIKPDLELVIENINKLIKTYKKGKLITEGIKLAIVGRPNVGKSSLFNAFVGYERAIVSDIKGTTRDFIEEEFNIKGFPIKLIDTAGIREAKDKLEKIGIQKAKEKIDEADIILFIFDASVGITEEDKQVFNEIKHKNVIIIGNKIDLGVEENSIKDYFKNKELIFTSSKTQEGLSRLEEKIVEKLGLLEDTNIDIYINIRHLQALEKAKQTLEKILSELSFYEYQKEILMLEIREANYYLKEIIGEIHTEELLGNIFSSFCIGK
ncbi:MAG TPA: tRNA uridine-5-carboxymethylaminomethyl(34) synthesis GTPase MnmE [Persephonella sp.]|nr:tRNA uridine-5-carboxymethylaminomethyl(34) synthesis GTPase MnmE [Hydrogenothermaceae bacterium]HIQ24351.1 tRNA uridine-5-carboxymethylaminomethyl(34) synthesis GTPase MnmE [Persephonella sp.]